MKKGLRDAELGLGKAKAKNPYDYSQLKETMSGKNENRLVFKLLVATPEGWSDKWKEASHVVINQENPWVLEVLGVRELHEKST